MLLERLCKVTEAGVADGTGHLGDIQLTPAQEPFSGFEALGSQVVKGCHAVRFLEALIKPTLAHAYLAG